MAEESNINETEFGVGGGGAPATTEAADTDKSELQKNLVSQVSAVHDALRRKFRKCDQSAGNEGPGTGTDWEEDWNEHTQNRDGLEAYAKAMHQLATEVWDPRHHNSDQAQAQDASSSIVKCRIEWVVLKCQEHFGGSTDADFQHSKLKLLDIGSCYNPFSKYSQLFDITALDLQPAPGYEKEVYRCDFLKLEVSGFDSPPEVETSGEMLDLVSLPEGYFDAVVFSFMLEYLPSPRQRLECCFKARSLLKPAGLVFILRPESNAVTATCAKWMKQWKVGLGYLGFRRVFLEKLEHFWGAGYSKLENEQAVEEYLNSKRFLKDVHKLLGDNVSMDMTELHKLFTIPQDFSREKNDEETSAIVSTSRSSTADDEVVEDLFNELPFEL